MEAEYRVEAIPAMRKTVGIRVKDGNTVEVRYPMGMPQAELRRLLQSKESWIGKNLLKQKQSEQKTASLPPLSAREIQRLADQACRDLPPRLNSFAKQIGVFPAGVTVRCQKTRWGSCSSGGRLNFNCLLMLAPETVRDYVVVHELCHLKEMNHSSRFWALVQSILPDYKNSIRWLKTEGSALIARAQAGGK